MNKVVSTKIEPIHLRTAHQFCVDKIDWESQAAIYYYKTNSPWVILYLNMKGNYIADPYPLFQTPKLRLFAQAKDWAEEKYGSAYVQGFQEGFAHIRHESSTICKTPQYKSYTREVFNRYKEGRIDGKAYWK